MKNISKFLGLLAIACFFAISGVKAQDVVVRARLYSNHSNYHRPPRPSRAHVWVSDEWTPNSNRGYDHHDGYWAQPQQPRQAYYKGHWRRAPSGGGYVWMAGHWGRQ